MKDVFNREWLENYKTIPKRDNAIYKNYQNPGMTNWDRQFGSLSPAQKERYQGFLNTIPNEIRGISAAEMQKYLQGVEEKQNALAQERAGYEGQIHAIRNQEAQRQAQLETQRPYKMSSNFTGGNPVGYYQDTNKLMPFNSLVKRLIDSGQFKDQSYMNKVYRGYSRTQDPYRPFVDTGNGKFVYLLNSETVPSSVIEKYKSKGNFHGWYPLLEDT